MAGTAASPAAPARRDVRRAARVARPAPTAPVAAPASYVFSTVLDGRPIRWDPCTPIRWTANVTHGPVGALDVLHDAVDRIAAVTGTSWEYVGPSAAIPSTAHLPVQAQPEYPPVLLGWTDGASSDLLAGQEANVLGMSRTSWFGVQREDGSKIAATRAAVIAFDRTDTLPLRGPGSWRALALHELAHVMGLGHVSDPTQLMAGVLPPVADLQPGDQAGLHAVGLSAGCVVVP